MMVCEGSKLCWQWWVCLQTSYQVKKLDFQGTRVKDVEQGDMQGCSSMWLQRPLRTLRSIHRKRSGNIHSA